MGGGESAGKAVETYELEDSNLFNMGIRRARGCLHLRGERSCLFTCRSRLGEYILVATSAGFRMANGK